MIYMYVWWSAWTRDIFQRFSSSWSPRSFSHAPTSGISRGSCLSHSLLCIFFRTCVRLMSVRYLCHFMYCTDHYWKKSHTDKLHCLLKDIYGTMRLHTMETVRIFQRLLLTMMMIIFIEFAVEFQWILELNFSDDIAGKVVFKFTLLFPFTIFLIL